MLAKQFVKKLTARSRIIHSIVIELFFYRITDNLNYQFFMGNLWTLIRVGFLRGVFVGGQFDSPLIFQAEIIQY